MTLTVAARARLLASTAVAAITTNIMPLRQEQGSVGPTVVLQVVSEKTGETHDGLGPFITRLQVKCIAETYDEADSLRLIVRQALVPGTGIWGSLAVQRVHLTSTVFDGIDRESGWHFCTRDYMVWHEAES
jgi:hypothetical protein